VSNFALETQLPVPDVYLYGEAIYALPFPNRSQRSRVGFDSLLFFFQWRLYGSPTIGTTRDLARGMCPRAYDHLSANVYRDPLLSLTRPSCTPIPFTVTGPNRSECRWYSLGSLEDPLWRNGYASCQAQLACPRMCIRQGRSRGSLTNPLGGCERSDGRRSSNHLIPAPAEGDVESIQLAGSLWRMPENSKDGHSKFAAVVRGKWTL